MSYRVAEVRSPSSRDKGKELTEKMMVEDMVSKLKAKVKNLATEKLEVEPLMSNSSKCSLTHCISCDYFIIKVNSRSPVKSF